MLKSLRKPFLNHSLPSSLKPYTLTEHPQTNGQAEAANKVILNGLKKRLGKANGRWTEELIKVL